jgi:hypothetical protein
LQRRDEKVELAVLYLHGLLIEHGSKASGGRVTVSEKPCLARDKMIDDVYWH